MTNSSLPPAGWYTDTEDPSRERMHDGVQWTDSFRRPRRKFAASHANVRRAVIFLVIGGIFLLSCFGAIGNIAAASSPDAVGAAVGGLILSILIAGGFTAWGTYLVRGEGEDPAQASRRAQTQLVSEARYQEKLDRLAKVSVGAAGVVNLRNVDAAAKAAYGSRGPEVSAEALATLGVDRASLSSPEIGNLKALQAGRRLELFEDWVILGLDAHDVDEHTRMNVFLDGGIQIVPTQVTRGKAVVTVNEQHDMRKAEVQVLGADWSIRVAIRPDDVGDARRLSDLLNSHVNRRKPSGVTAADIKSMVDTILNNTGQPQAEKLKQLSNLRYDRLLSDAEFEQVRVKILGLQNS